MKIIKGALILAISFSSLPVLANMMADDADNNCKTVAKACMAAGFQKGEDSTKKFWQDCMKPVLMGKPVQGVTVDPKVAEACRAAKMDKMKGEMQDFQNAAPK
jgi:hypothetical protein